MARLLWDEREQLILEAIRDMEDDDPDLQNGAIEEATGLSEKDVGLGLQALIDDDYIAGSDGRGYAEAVGAYVIGARLAPKGRRHVKQWPSRRCAPRPAPTPGSRCRRRPRACGRGCHRPPESSGAAPARACTSRDMA